MNKPYFTKYLPIDGEIKVGDKIILNNAHPQGRIRTAYRITQNNRLWNGLDWDTIKGKHYFIDPTPKDGAGFATELECKKAQLFLCSKDIKVGDKFRCELFEEFKCKKITEGDGLNHFPKETLIWTWDRSTKNIKYWRPASECFKVIGPISQEATWVKEGDKFNEDEWRNVKECYEVDGHYTLIDYEKELLNKEGYEIQIKGPCGHYH